MTAFAGAGIVAAIVFGIMRWPWWTLPPVIAATLSLLWYVDLNQIRQVSGESNDIRNALNDEGTIIAMGFATFALVVLYIVGRGIHALTFGSDATKADVEPEIEG